MGEPVSGPALLGRRLGEFILREHIGEGGFGMVFRAEQPTLERDAVVKVSLRSGDDEIVVERFLREARLASRIDHPFAAHVYAFGAEPDGLLWIAMERVRGTPLDVLLEDGPLAMEHAIPLIHRLCEVVHTAHEQGIVHRDLKPSNVMAVMRAGNLFPKLLDLGIAKDLRAATIDGMRPAGTAGRVDRTSHQLGTPLYMAPEQWVDASRAGPPADIYALGGLAYTLLVGTPPFPGRTVLDIAVGHAKKAVPRLPDSMPSTLSDAIARAMAKRPSERYPTALAFAEALRETSGVALEAINLPHIDAITRDEVLLRAPRPLAEATAALEAARNPPQTIEAMWELVRTCAQLVGVIALGCRSRVGSGQRLDPPEVAELLVALRQRGLDPADWWRLARELCRPFAELANAHPVPPLVGVFFEKRAELATALDQLLQSRATAPGPTKPADEIRSFLLGAIPTVAAALRSLGPLFAYTLAVPARGELPAETWTGVRRPFPTPLMSAVPIHQVALLDPEGAVAVVLEPAAQVASPGPGLADELFVVDGPGRVGARLRSMPRDLVRHDDQLWARLGLRADVDEDPSIPDEQPPYRGLSTFTEADAGRYVGREREVEGFVNRLATTPMIVVVGPSGVGKSSFIQAGVLPALAGTWRTLVFRPGATPLATLAARAATLGVEHTADTLRATPERLGDELRARQRATQEHLLVVVDQFEELFTQCLDTDEQATFARTLAAIARSHDDGVRVVLTLRDDFLVRAAQLVALRERLATCLQILTTPDPSDLLRILVEPARRVGYSFEDTELPEAMVREVAGQPAALALLSFTAEQLWRLRDRGFRRFTRKAYGALGGVGGALAQHAESTLDGFAPSERLIVRELFRQLVTAEGTRATMTRAELLEVCGAGTDAVLENLIGARLLQAMESVRADDDAIEVVHEALLSAWPRAVGWRHEDAEGARLRDQVRVAARQWLDRARPRGLLWRGEALAEYSVWRARYRGALTELEEEFGRASLAEAARGTRIRRILLASLFAGLSVALVVFVRLRSVAETSRVRAEAGEAEVAARLIETYEETGRRALIARDPASALLYLHEALRRGADRPAVRFMLARALAPLTAELATLEGHEGPVWDVAFSPSGDKLATGAVDGTARVWSATGQLLSVIEAGEPEVRVAIAWRAIANGEELATGTARALRLWGPPAFAQHTELFGAGPPINTIATLSDGSIVAATANGDVRRWDAQNKLAFEMSLGPQVDTNVRGASDNAFAVAGTSPDANGGFGGLTIVRDGKRLDLAGHTAGVWYAAISPDGKHVASASLDRTSRIYDARTGALEHLLGGHENRITDVVWSPDSKTIATASADQTIRLWDASSGAVKVTLRGHTAQVNRLAFLRDGALLASAGSDGTARIWDASRGALLATLGHPGFVFSLDVSPDGASLATSSWQGNAKLWRLDAAGLPRTLRGGTLASHTPTPRLASNGTRAIRWTDAGLELWDLATSTRRQIALPNVVATDATDTTIAAGRADGHVDVIAQTTGAITRSFEAGPGLAALAMHGDDVALVRDTELALWSAGEARATATLDAPGLFVVFDDSGQRVVVVTDLGTTLFDRALGKLGSGPSAGTRVVFSPRGDSVAFGAGQAVIVLGRDGRQLARLEAKATVNDLVWSPDGERIFGTTSDGALQSWRVATWTPIARVTAHDAWIPSVSISSDGTMLVTAGSDDRVKVFELETLRNIFELRAALGTTWAVLDADRLITADAETLDVWVADRTRATASEIQRVIDCRLPYTLSGQTVVPRAITPCSR